MRSPLLVSAVLLALRDNAFRVAWPSTADDDLADFMLQAVERVAIRAIKDEGKRVLMLSAYAFISTHPELARNAIVGKGSQRREVSPLRHLIDGIAEHVRPFVDTYTSVDVVGQFYGEFLRYTGGDKRGLGIVLTPRHLTELFAELAQVTASDTVIDTCAGTGGFLIAAMAVMDRQVGDDAARRTEIRAKRLVGIEQQPNMFALCAANMILRGDGRANLYRGSCFDPELAAALASATGVPHPRPTKALLNPPFSQKGEGQHELEFVAAALDILAPGGLAVAVVPMSCAIAPNRARHELLKRHTLVAAMSLPNDLFAPVGTVPCALVLRAHDPHATSGAKTWFGFWKNDGFVKTKDRGRIDLNGEWDQIRRDWVQSFRDRVEFPGRSVMHEVTAEDEWCAEAYLETDYSVVTPDLFEDAVKRYALYRLLQVAPEGEAEA